MNPNILIPIYVGIALIGIVCIVVDMMLGESNPEKIIIKPKTISRKQTDLSDFIVSDDLIEDTTY